MTGPFRTRLLQGETLLGTLLTLPSPEIAEILAAIGFDWLFIDAEHAPFSTRAIQCMLQAAGGRSAVLVRLASGSEVAIKKALDVGADGIIVPQVNSAEQAARIVRLAKYAPAGCRGVGVGRAHAYGIGFQDYLDSANDTLTVVIQAEHIEAVMQIEAIVRVPGVDAVLVGPYDLSASLGKIGRVDDPEVTDAIEQVTAACRNAGVRLGIFGVSAEAVRPYMDKGYTLIVAGVDTILLTRAAQTLLADLNT